MSEPTMSLENVDMVICKNHLHVVVCQICGVERRRLGAHIKATHAMTVEEYKTKYPDALTEVPGSRKRSPECRAKQSVAAFKRWANPDERAAQSVRLKKAAPWKGKKFTDEHKRAISRGGRGISHKLTDESRQAQGDRGRRVLSEIRNDPQVRLKIGAATRRRFQQGEQFGFRSPGVFDRIMASKVRNGTVVSANAGRGITGFRVGIPHYCRSTLEANFARVLISENIPYEYEPKVFLLPNGQRWTPDFLLARSLGNLVPAGWVELKGWRNKDGTLPGAADSKIKAFESMTGEHMTVVTQDSTLWGVIEKRYAGKGAWETGRRNRRTHPEVFGRTK